MNKLPRFEKKLEYVEVMGVSIILGDRGTVRGVYGGVLDAPVGQT